MNHTIEFLFDLYPTLKEHCVAFKHPDYGYSHSEMNRDISEAIQWCAKNFDSGKVLYNLDELEKISTLAKEVHWMIFPSKDHDVFWFKTIENTVMFKLYCI